MKNFIFFIALLTSGKLLAEYENIVCSSADPRYTSRYFSTNNENAANTTPIGQPGGTDSGGGTQTDPYFSSSCLIVPSENSSDLMYNDFGIEHLGDWDSYPRAPEHKPDQFYYRDSN